MRLTVKWWDIQSILLATLVAALIWFWAEGESLSSLIVPVRVSFPAENTADLVIRPEDPTWKGNLRVRLEGSTLVTNAAAGLLGSAIRLSPGLPGMPSEPGEQRVVDLREALSNHPDVKRTGATIADVEPRVVVVRVIRMTTKELPIRAELAREVPLDGDPTPTPAVATFRIPESAAAAIPDGAQATAYVGEQDLARLRGDGPQTVPGVVRPPAALLEVEPVFASPESVSVLLRVKRKVETFKIATVPVWFSLPPTEDGTKWSVEVLDKFISDVTVSGTSDQVAKVRAGEAPIKAMIELSTDDLEKAAPPNPPTPAQPNPAAAIGVLQPAPNTGVLTKQATFVGAPAGLTCTAASQAVRVRISRNQTQAAPGGGG